MIELYAYPDTYSIGVHLLLEECGVDYRVVDVCKFSSLAEADRVAADEDFRKVSPHRRVPALRLANGNGFCESGAIALYLSDHLNNGHFSVSGSDPHRPEYLQWLFYLSSTLQPEIMLQFHPEYYFDDQQLQEKLRLASQQRLDTVWPILETRYSKSRGNEHAGTANRSVWMFGDLPSAVDFCLVPVLLWDESFPGHLHNYPALAGMLHEVRNRPACARVLKWHGYQ